jgi:predicted RecA/RadA family phage recombinase
MAIATREAILKQNVANAVQLTWTNSTGSDVSIGEVLGISAGSGKRIAVVALEAISSGSSGQVLKGGRVNIKKNTSTSFSLGDPVCWDYDNDEANTASVANTIYDFVVGACTVAASSSASHVEVDLNEGPSAYDMGSSSSSSSSSETS